jgi:hypothetical protein
LHLKPKEYGRILKGLIARIGTTGAYCVPANITKAKNWNRCPSPPSAQQKELVVEEVVSCLGEEQY